MKNPCKNKEKILNQNFTIRKRRYNKIDQNETFDIL